MLYSMYYNNMHKAVFNTGNIEYKDYWWYKRLMYVCKCSKVYKRLWKIKLLSSCLNGINSLSQPYDTVTNEG